MSDSSLGWLRVQCVGWWLVWLLSGCDDKVVEPAPPEPPKIASAPAPPEAVAPTPSASAVAAEREAAPEEVAAQHVLVAYRGAKRAPKEVKRSKPEARERASEVLAKAREGTDFSELAEQFSDDSGGKSNRGNLGKFKREAMVPKFSDAAFQLRVGEISEVVETEFGFHVIKRNQ